MEQTLGYPLRLLLSMSVRTIKRSKEEHEPVAHKESHTVQSKTIGHRPLSKPDTHHHSRFRQYKKLRDPKTRLANLQPNSTAYIYMAIRVKTGTLQNYGLEKLGTSSTNLLWVDTFKRYPFGPMFFSPQKKHKL